MDIKHKHSICSPLLLTPFLTYSQIIPSNSVVKIHNKKVTARTAVLRKYFQLGEEKLKTNLLPFVCASFASVAMRECDGFCLNSAARICCTWMSSQPDKQRISREGGERVK